jgi:hypothetical protein
MSIIITNLNDESTYEGVDWLSSFGSKKIGLITGIGTLVSRDTAVYFYLVTVRK